MIDTQALQSLFDDETLVRTYLKRFMEDMPDLLRQMRIACESKQWNEVSIHAHSYKSQMQYIKDTHARGLVHELEIRSASASPDIQVIEDLIRQLEVQLTHTLVEIKQIIG